VGGVPVPVAYGRNDLSSIKLHQKNIKTLAAPIGRMQMTNILPMQMCGVRGVLVELLESPRKRMYLGRQWNVGRGENDVELHYIGRRTKLDFFSGQL
jgi:hypothetical protein